MSTSSSTRKPWSLEEDTVLRQLVEENGSSGCWPKIAQSMHGRTGKQCRERYTNHLDPGMKKTAWSMEESKIIRDLFPKFGTKWSQYMTFLPGRSDNSIKNRYHTISRNNFEYFSNSHMIFSYKRALSVDSDGDTNKEDYSSHANRKQLNKLIAVRDEIDREIQELENQRTAATSCAPPSTEDVFAEFKAVPTEGNDPDFTFDFEWIDSIAAEHSMG